MEAGVRRDRLGERYERWGPTRVTVLIAATLLAIACGFTTLNFLLIAAHLDLALEGKALVLLGFALGAAAGGAGIGALMTGGVAATQDANRWWAAGRPAEGAAQVFGDLSTLPRRSVALSVLIIAVLELPLPFFAHALSERDVSLWVTEIGVLANVAAGALLGYLALEILRCTSSRRRPSRSSGATSTSPSMTSAGTSSGALPGASPGW